MDGLLVTWLDGWFDGGMDDERMVGEIIGWMVDSGYLGQMVDGWINGLIYVWMGDWMDGWLDRWLEGMVWMVG